MALKESDPMQGGLIIETKQAKGAIISQDLLNIKKKHIIVSAKSLLGS